MPSERMLTEMGKFNEELVKAGVMLAGEGLHPSSKGKRVRFSGKKRHRDRRPLRRDEGADRRLLAVAGEVEGRSDRVGQAHAQSCGRSGRRDRDLARCFEAAGLAPRAIATSELMANEERLPRPG